MYQMDLFSLLSFGLAIAALLISGFMGWLSWELYKKTADVSESTKDAVSRVEATVESIQSDITEIVRQAVGHWIDGSRPSFESDDVTATDEKIENLTEQVRRSLASTPDNVELFGELDEMLQAQNREIDRLTESLLDARAKSLFPGIDRGPAAHVTQIETDADGEIRKGSLIIEVIRGTRNATGTGVFSPPMRDVPHIQTSLVESPYESDPPVVVSAGAGLTTDFNIHIRGKARALRKGTYVVEYTASVPD